MELQSAVFEITHCILCVVIGGKEGLGIIYVFIMYSEKVTFEVGFPCKYLVTPVASN